jgi:lysophospholipase L1-like esterase
MQFDDTFSKRLERWLNLNTQQPPVEVINYGVPRYSTSHEVAVVERAIKEGADLVVLQITLNDPEIKPYRPTGLLVDENTGNVAVTNPILRHWRSLGYVVTRFKNTATHREYVRYFFKLFDGKKTWRQFTDSLTGIVKRSADAGVPLVATVFPLFGHPVNTDYPFYPLHEKVAGALKERGIPSLDIAEHYRDMPLDRLQVIPIADRHPNEIGHRIAAEAMLPWLQSLNLLPPTIFPRRVVPERIGIIPPDAPPPPAKAAP